MQKKIAILFLDVDGVLNDKNTIDRCVANGIKYTGVDVEKINLLNRIVSETHCYIVISSSWRKTYEMLPQLFRRMGLIARWVIGFTPILDHEVSGIGIYWGATRGQEIKAWMDTQCTVPVEHCNFCILDDDYNMDPVKEFWVQTHVGLTAEIAEQVIKKLKGIEI